MWTHRDYLTLATAAVATFGLTVAGLYTRAVHAVDEKPIATADVKIPTLTLGAAQVTAALDKLEVRTVSFTIRNNSQDAAKAEFTARAMVVDPSSGLSRRPSFGREVWTQDFSIDLKPGESRAVTATLPKEAFGPEEATKAETATDKPALRLTVPGRSYLTLGQKVDPSLNQPGLQIQALSLWIGKSPTDTVAAMQSQVDAVVGSGSKNAP